MYINLYVQENFKILFDQDMIYCTIQVVEIYYIDRLQGDCVYIQNTQIGWGEIVGEGGDENWVGG